MLKLLVKVKHTGGVSVGYTAIAMPNTTGLRDED
jgi:hypothetical protein